MTSFTPIGTRKINGAAAQTFRATFVFVNSPSDVQMLLYAGY